MSVYTEIEKMILDFNTQVLSLAQQNQDLKIENASLKSLVETYKAKADLLIERVRPHDSDMWPGDEELLKQSGEPAVIGLTVGSNVIPLTVGKVK